MDNFLNLFEGDKDYQENVKYCINNFEEIIGKKRSQKEKKYKPKNWLIKYNYKFNNLNY